MEVIDFKCSQYHFVKKICRSKKGEGLIGCPKETKKKTVTSVMVYCKDQVVREFARLTSVKEGACYALRDAGCKAFHDDSHKEQEGRIVRILSYDRHLYFTVLLQRLIKMEFGNPEEMKNRLVSERAMRIREEEMEVRK